MAKRREWSGTLMGVPGVRKREESDGAFDAFIREMPSDEGPNVEVPHSPAVNAALQDLDWEDDLDLDNEGSEPAPEPEPAPTVDEVPASARVPMGLGDVLQSDTVPVSKLKPPPLQPIVQVAVEDNYEEPEPTSLKGWIGVLLLLLVVGIAILVVVLASL